MEKDTKQPLDFFTKAQISALKAEVLPVEHRLSWVTDWLKESGASPEALMLGYFNECMRVATESRGVMGSYIMANQLHWHIVQVIRKLHATSQAAILPELPEDPTVRTPTPEI
jgi:hypothetical protein